MLFVVVVIVVAPIVALCPQPNKDQRSVEQFIYYYIVLSTIHKVCLLYAH